MNQTEQADDRVTPNYITGQTNRMLREIFSHPRSQVDRASNLVLGHERVSEGNLFALALICNVLTKRRK